MFDCQEDGEHIRAQRLLKRVHVDVGEVLVRPDGAGVGEEYVQPLVGGQCVLDYGFYGGLVGSVEDAGVCCNGGVEGGEFAGVGGEVGGVEVAEVDGEGGVGGELVRGSAADAQGGGGAGNDYYFVLDLAGGCSVVSMLLYYIKVGGRGGKRVDVRACGGGSYGTDFGNVFECAWVLWRDDKVLRELLETLFWSGGHGGMRRGNNGLGRGIEVDGTRGTRGGCHRGFAGRCSGDKAEVKPLSSEQIGSTSEQRPTGEM